MFRWTADIVDMIFCCAKNLIHVMGKVVRKVGLICIGEHLSGPEIAAVIRSRGVAAKQGFLMYYSKGDAIGDQGKCPL